MNSRILIIFVTVILLLVAAAAKETLAQPGDTIFYQDVSWSPDGSKLLLSRLDIKGDSYLYHIYSVNTDGSNYTKITEGPDDVWSSWFRDGSKFVYSSKKNGNSDIYLTNADGAGTSRLTSDSADEFHPDW